MRTKHPTQGKAIPKTGAETARVGSAYERLDVAGTKQVYKKLNGKLDKLAVTVLHTLDQAVPYLEQMQSLLSQRGAERKKVLRKAGLPGWTPWVKAYAAKFDWSVRTIQDRIKQFRNPRGEETGELPTKRKGNGPRDRLRLNARQQSALVKAQMAANDLAAALRNGADWEEPLAEYEKIAVTPSTLDQFVNALSPEPDWKRILTDFSSTLGQCAELPAEATNALHKVQRLLGEQATSYPSPSGSEATANPPEYEATESSEEVADPRTIQELAIEDSPVSLPSAEAIPAVIPQPADEGMVCEVPSAVSAQSSEQAPQAAANDKELRRKLQKAAAQKKYLLKKKSSGTNGVSPMLPAPLVVSASMSL